MQFANHRSLRDCRRYACPLRTLSVSIALFSLLVGCTYSSLGLKMEPGSVAKRFGLTGCRVSIPLTATEVIEQAKRDGDPRPESRPEWGRMLNEVRSGDQFRLVNCVRTDRSGVSGGAYYFALFRKDVVIGEMHHVIVN